MDPIVMDIEISGMDKVNCGIWQIGTIDLNNPEDQFLEEARIDEEDVIEKKVINFLEKTEGELRNKNKQSQIQMLKKFFYWVNERLMKNFLCQNPQFDLAWLNIRAEKYGLEKTYPYRAFDLHTIAQMKYKEINGDFLMANEKSDMNLSKVLELCGLKDERMQMKGKDIVKEGKSHNALEDAKLTAECFRRLIK